MDSNYRPMGPAYAADKGGVYVSVKGAYEAKDSSGGTSDTAAAATNQNSTNSFRDRSSGWALGGALGYNFAGMGVPVRAEAEYLYHSQFKLHSTNSTTGIVDAKYDIQTGFANFYYDIKTGTSFTPYVGAGLGVAWINQKVSENSAAVNFGGNHDTTNFAWNLGAGVGYSLTDNIVIDLGYRYTSFGDAKKINGAAIATTHLQTKDITAHEALLGLRYQF